ncbi:hypothetical protein B0H16DRAFT_1808465, partial [Mycena metata]
INDQRSAPLSAGAQIEYKVPTAKSNFDVNERGVEFLANKNRTRLDPLLSASPLTMDTLLAVVRVARGTLWVRKQLAQNASWDTIKSQVTILTAGATIVSHNGRKRISAYQRPTKATFLAAVQGQIVALSYQNNSTRLKVATNALGFADVVLDVAAACIALLASTTLQRYIPEVEKQLDAIQDASREQLEEIARFIHADVQGSLGPHTVSWDVYRRALGKVGDRLVALDRTSNHGDPEAGGEIQLYHPTSSLELDIGTIPRAFREIRTVEASGDAAGIAMQCGILCFFGSVLCLAIASQPRAVWVSSSMIFALVTFLPLVMQALGRAGIRKLVTNIIFSV